MVARLSVKTMMLISCVLLSLLETAVGMANCRHTFPSGNTFDLTGLHRPRG